jgi:hypothetical protein
MFSPSVSSPLTWRPGRLVRRVLLDETWSVSAVKRVTSCGVHQSSQVRALSHAPIVEMVADPWPMTAPMPP